MKVLLFATTVLIVIGAIHGMTNEDDSYEASTDLDAALQSFLALATTKRLARRKADAVKNLYNLYKTKFNRNWQTTTEEKLRFISFNDTLNVILDHHRQGAKAYTLGLNHFADWTQDELSKLRGVQVPEGIIDETNAKPTDHLLTWDGRSSQTRMVPPISFDFTTRVAGGTNVPVVPPIKNQGQCGSCYAFAFISLLEFQYAVQLKKSNTLSEQQMIDCSTQDKGCNGGYFTNTFSYLQSNLWHVDSESNYPYKTAYGTCAFKGAGVKFGSLVYKMIDTNNAAAMKQALVDYGPLWVSLFVGDQKNSTYQTIASEFQRYKSGIFQPSGCPTSRMTTNHAVVIVGYGVDATTNTPYWKVRNSYGTSWGENGYFKISFGVNMCGIESGAYYIARTA